MALLTVGPTFDQAKKKINKISLQILGIWNSEIWLFDDVSKINVTKSLFTFWKDGRDRKNPERKSRN